MFNNHLQANNLLTSSYLNGNILFQKDNIIYTPILNYIKQIDLNNNKTMILPFQTHNQIKIIALHPQSILLVAIDIVGYAVVFNLKGMFVVGEYNFKGGVISAKFSQDGVLFGVGMENGFTVYRAPSVWKTFQPFVLLKKYKNRHSGQITSIQFSPDSRFLLTSGVDNIIYINNIFSMKQYIAVKLQVHRYKILGTSCSKDMKYIYTVDTGSNIYVWKWVQDMITDEYKNYKDMRIRERENRRNGGRNRDRSGMKDKVKKQVQQQQQQQQGNQQQIINQQQHKQQYKNYKNYSQLQLKLVQTAGRYILSKKLTVTQPGTFLKRYFYNNNTGFLATAYNNGKFVIYKLVEQQLNQVQNFTVGNFKISSICVNQSCTWLALGIKEAGQIIVWQWKSQSYILSQKGLVFDTLSLASHKTSKYIATGTSQGQVKLWQKSSGLSIATFTQHDASVTDLKFSNANTLFSCSLDGSVHAYDAVKYRKFRSYRPDTKSQFQCLALDEAGQIVLAGAFDPYQIYAWNVQTANILQIIRGHDGPISCLELAGDYLISGSWDKTLKLHQLYARKLNVQTLEHSSQVTALAVHPDGKQYAAATIRGQIYLWQIQDNQLIGIIDAEVKGGRSYFSKISAQNDTNTKYLKTIVYSDCGKYLIGAGKSKYLYFYDIEHRMLMDKIQLTKNRDLQGVIQKLNSKFIKGGQSTYEMMLQEQEKGNSDQQQNIKLPGSKKVDISQIRKKLQVDVRKIIVLDSHSLAVCTSFGVFTYSTSLYNRHIFNPHELDPTLTPTKIITMLQNKQYSSSISGAISMNLPVRKLIKKVPTQNIKQTIAQLDANKLNLLLEKLSEGGSLDFRECLWIDAILKYPEVKVPTNLALSLENMNQQVSILRRVQAKLEMGLTMSM